MNMSGPRRRRPSRAGALALVVGFALAGAGCTSTSEGRDLAGVDRLRPDSTKADVIALLGVPTSVRRAAGGGQVLVYNSSTKGRGVGLGLGSGSTSLVLLQRLHVAQDSAQVTLDAEGRVIGAYRTVGISRVSPWPFE